MITTPEECYKISRANIAKELEFWREFWRGKKLPIIMKNNCQECSCELTTENRVTHKEFPNTCYSCYKEIKPRRLAIDFDGVMAEYTGWKGEQFCGSPIPGLENFLLTLINFAIPWEIIVHTTRDPGIVWFWLKAHKLEGYITRVTNEKEPAEVYLDDKAIQFNGDFDKTLKDIIHFKPHWKK